MANYNSSYTGTEIDRVVGYGINVSSDIQTQLNNKEATLTKGDLTESTSSVLTLTGNTSAIIGSGLTIQVKEASGSQSGYITSTDWTTFNSKQSAITGGATTITTSDLTASRALVSDGSGKVAVSSVTSTVLGYLDATSSVQTQLNAKEPTLSKGNLAEATSSVLTIGNGSNAVIGTGTTIAVTQATTSTSGYLSSTDWNTFNSKQATITGGASSITTSDLTASRALVSDGSGKVAVSSVTSTILEYLDATSSVQTQLNSKEPTVTKGDLTESTSSVLTISGGTGSQIGSGTSLQVKQATTSQDGYLSSSDWNVFNNKQATNVTTDISGTSNQINLSASGTNAILGSTPITLSLPQDIDTSADVNFANLNLSALTASRALIIDGSKDLASSVTTSDEISYLNGVTSAVQTQLDSKQKEIYKTVASSGGDYTGLKEAIDDGATKIFIKNGTYLEATPINITNDGTEIIGENIENTVVEFGVGQDGVRVYANSTKIQNLTLDADVNNSAAAYVLGDGQVAGSPDINNGNNNTLDHCIIRGGSTTFTIYVAGASYLAGTPTLLAFEANELQHNNKIENCILESTWDGDAFSFSLQKDGSISNNYCEGGRIAYYMNRDTNCVNNSIVDSVNQGIFVGCPAYGNNLNGNRIYNPTSSGIKVQNQLEHTPLLTDQRAFNNNFNENVIYLTGNTGIEVTGDTDHEPKGNNFVGNTIFKPDNHGIYIQDAHFNNFNNNAIYQPRNDTGTYARGSGFYLVQNVENNNMNDNLIIDERANQLHTAIANREGTDCPNNSVIGNRIIASNSERTVWVQSNGWIISGNYVNGGYYAGIYLDGADNCNVVGNICENNTNQANNAYYEIWLNNTADNNIVTNNTCISSAANVANADIVVSSGTGNIIENNIGIGTTGEYASILSGLQDMGTGTGIVAQTGNTSFAKRTITGTANQITVADGDGVSANPTLSLPTAVYIGAGQIGRDANNLIDFSTNNVISFKTNNTASQFVIDASGNIGINTNDIESWDSAYVAIQFPVAAVVGGSTTSDLCLVNNAYNDGNMRYRIDGYAQKIDLASDGSINFQISKQDGTANGTIVWNNTFMIDYLGLVSIENKNTGDNTYGFSLKTEIEDSINASNGIAYFYSGGSYVDTGNTSDNQYGLHVETYIDSNNHRGTLTNMYGVSSLTGITNAGSGGAVTNNVAFDALVYADDGGTITNSYMFRGGIYGATPTVIANNWGLYLTNEERNYLSGALGVGVEPDTTYIINGQSDQAGGTIFGMTNNTNGTGAFVGHEYYSNTLNTSTRVLSATYTTSGLSVANSTIIYSNNCSSGLRVFTQDATDLTLGTSNTARLTIDSTGDATFSGGLGVGVAPTSNFIGNFLSTQNAGTYVYVNNLDTGVNALSGVEANSTGGYISMRSYGTNYSGGGLSQPDTMAVFSSSATGGLNVFTQDAYSLTLGTNNTARMIIESDGKINTNGNYFGILTASPSNFLQVGSMGASGYSGNDLALGDGTYVSSLNADSNGLTLRSTVGYSFLSNTSTQALLINSSGNIGIGTTDIETWSGGSALEWTNSSIFSITSSPHIYTIANAYYDGAWKYKTSSSASLIDVAFDSITFNVAASGTANNAITWITPLTINSLGNIIASKSTDTSISITSTAADSYSFLALVNDAKQWSLICHTDDTFKIRDSTVGADRFVIDGSGNIGIGTTDIEAWASGNRAIEFYRSAILASTTSEAIHVMSGSYYDGAWKYKTTGAAVSKHTMDGGVHTFSVALSGTVDTAITWYDPLIINVNSTIDTSCTLTNSSVNAITATVTNLGTSTGTYYTSGLSVNASSSYVSTGVTNSGEYIGINSYAFINTSSHDGTLVNNYGISAATGIQVCDTSGTITNNYGYRSYIYNGAGTVTNSYMYYGTIGTSGGTITNNWGIYLSGETKNYLSGSLGIGTTSPNENFHIKGGNAIIGSGNYPTNWDTVAERGLKVASDYTYTTGTGTYIEFLRSNTASTTTSHWWKMVVDQPSASVSNWKLQYTSGSYGTVGTYGDILTVNSSGNIGIGTTDIEAWSGYTAIETYASSFMFGTSSGTMNINSNAFFDGAWKYKTTAEAVNLNLSTGGFEVRVASSGTADAAITWITPLAIKTNGTIDTSNTLLNVTDDFLSMTCNVQATSNGAYTNKGIYIDMETSYVASGVTNTSYTMGLNASTGIYNASHQGTLTTMYGISVDSGIGNCGTNGAITTNYGVRSYIASHSNSTITTSYMFYGAAGTGGTITNNWGIYLTGCDKNYLEGHTQITDTFTSSINKVFEVTGSAITTSTESLQAIGAYIYLSSSYVTTGQSNTSTVYGIDVSNYVSNVLHLGTFANRIGINATVGIGSCGTGGSITNNYGSYMKVLNTDSDGSMTSSYLYYGEVSGTAGTITNNWGIYLSGCTKSYIDGELDCDSYSVGGTSGVDFSGAITNLTIVKGIVTAAS